MRLPRGRMVWAKGTGGAKALREVVYLIFKCSHFTAFSSFENATC